MHPDAEIFTLKQIMGFYCCDYVDANGDTTITVREAEKMGWPVSYSSIRELDELEESGYTGKRDADFYADLVTDLAVGGFASPVVISYVEGDFYLVNGHHRIAAAIELGITEIPCMYSFDMYNKGVKGNVWSDGRTTAEHRGYSFEGDE